MRRHPLLVLLPVVLLAAAGIAVGLRTNPTYTATAQDVVQPLAPTVAQLPGAIQAAQDLASNESRLIDAAGVTGPLARQLGSSVGSIERRVSATPVPNSTVVKIDGESSTAQGAVSLTNAAARAFARYVNASSSQSEAEAETLLRQFRAASAEYVRTLSTKQRVLAAGKAAPAGAVIATTSAANAAQLRQQALSAQYQSLVQSQASAPRVTTFVVARTARSSRQAALQISGFGGGLAGLVIGAAFALLLANRRSRRVEA